MVISAEGMYDDTEGKLCMVGCRDLSTSTNRQPTNDCVDCEMVVHFEFHDYNPPKTSFIRGSIESTRNKSDPLYFERVELIAASYNYKVAQSNRLKDVEILLDNISNAVAYVSGILQLYHTKRHPEIHPFISICMLYILGLGYMLPLYFDAQSSQVLFSETTEWREFLTLVVLVVNFVLPLRILVLTWSAKLAIENQNKACALEKLTLLSALPVYAAGSFFALFTIFWGKRDYIVEMVTRYLGHDILGTVLKTCAGLVLDWFLLPQIVLFYGKSKEKSLPVSFFIGTTFVRVLPHAYALYKAHTFDYELLNDSYIYPNSAAFSM